MHRVTVALRHDVHGHFARAKTIDLDLARQALEACVDLGLDDGDRQGQGHLALEFFQVFDNYGHFLSPYRVQWAPDGARASGGILVRGGGLEPPQYCYRQDLNLVRLPISPPARDCKTATGGLLHSPPA